MGDGVTVLIDADPLVYRVGFSLEARIWYTEWVDVDPDHPNEREFDDLHTAKFYNAAARDAFCEYLNLDKAEIAHTLVSVPVAEEYVVQGRLKQALQDIEKNVADYLLLHKQEVGEVRLFLTGKDNFRDKVATILPYKGNRVNNVRPYWYSFIREYLSSKWGAETVDGMEADDAVSILQWQGGEGETIICTIDKDLENVPGHFYNYGTKEAKYISHEEAMVHFYRQCITGDATDNIPGCFKIGKKGAEKKIPKYTTENDMWLEVVICYAENMMKYPEKHAPHTVASESALENARLLWMLTHEGEVWTPPIIERY